MDDCDLLVIGSGPGGQKAAIAAAKLERTVVVVEPIGIYTTASCSVQP